MPRRNSWHVLIWLLAATFVVTGAAKLADFGESSDNFSRWGHSMSFMHVIGGLEVVGGLGLLMKRVATLAALGLIGLMFGALKTGIEFAEPLHVVLPALLIVLLVVVMYLRRRAVSPRGQPRSSTLGS